MVVVKKVKKFNISLKYNISEKKILNIRSLEESMSVRTISEYIF